MVKKNLIGIQGVDMKPVLMIHEIKYDLFQLPLQDYILTFDDGLFSQYYFSPLLKNINTRKILFISGKYVCRYNEKRPTYPTFYYSTTAEDARKCFDKSKGIVDHHYMTIPEIKHMKGLGFEIGGHGYDHIKTYSKKIEKRVEEMTDDTEKMIYWMQNILGVEPKSYCFPFNIEHDFLKEILRRKGIEEFYGKERIDVNELLNSISD